MKQANYNNQGRKSGGYPKFKIRTGMPLRSNGEPMLHASLPCREGRHNDCDGYQTFVPKKNITRGNDPIKYMFELEKNSINRNFTNPLRRKKGKYE